MRATKKIEWQWYEDVRSYDINPIFKEGSFEIILMVELASEYSNIIRQFNASTTRAGTIKTISYDVFIATIRNYATMTKPPSNVQHVVLFKMLCNIAMSYLNTNNHLPADQTACLLKLLIAVMSDDGTEQNPLTPVSSTNIGLNGKYLFYVLNGFYDINLIKEMWKVKIPPTAILAISGNMVNTSDISNSSLIITSRLSSNSFDVILKQFWNKIYKYLEERQELRYLQDCIYMKAHLDNYYDQEKTFSIYYIHEQIFKIPGIKRLYSNYIKGFKVLDFVCKPKYFTTKPLKIYNAVMDSIPPDCFSIGFLLHALLEQVCSMISVKTYRTKKVKKPSSVIKSFINLTIRNYKIDILTHNVSKSSLNIKVSEKGFVTDAANTFEYKAKSYPTLSKKLIKINTKMLLRSRVSVLWKKFPSDNLLSILRVQFLEKIRNLLDYPPDQKLFYDINKSLFRTEFCSEKLFAEEVESDLRSSWYRKDINKYTPKIQIYENKNFSVSKSDLNNDFTEDDNHLSLYESLNIHLYMWYEEFVSEVMVQQLHQAINDYLCVDYTYNLLHDTLLLRFHNCVDEFGIKTFHWNEWIRTPVCLRDFCKYHVDQDDLLPNDEEYYSNEIDNMNKARPLYAYNMERTIVQLEGGKTTFTSLDGYKITVDDTKLLKVSTISINVSIKNNSLIFHCPRRDGRKFCVGFHYALHDGTIIAFNRSCFKPQLHFGEIINLKKRKLLSQPKLCNGNYHYTVETKHANSTLVNTDIVTKSSTTKNHKLIQLPYKNFDQTASDFESLIDSNLFPSSSEKTFPCFSQNAEDLKVPVTATNMLYSGIGKCLQTRQISINKKCDRKGAELTCNSFKNKTDLKDLKTDVTPKVKTVLKNIEYARAFQLPWFKVCSSPLHKRNYIKRVKSYIRVNLGNRFVTLACRHPPYKCMEVNKIVRLFPEYVRSRKNSSVVYDMRITVPTGLAIYSVPGTTNMLNIKQRYVNRGPQCKNLENEYSRTFMTNGYVSVRKTNGTVDVFTSSGEIYSFSVPYAFEKTVTRLKLVKKKILNHALTKLERKIWHTTHRRSYHFIETRKHCSRKKQKFKSPVQYKYVSSYGLQVQSIGLNFPKQTQISYTRKLDRNSQEYLLIRNDGTKLLLNGNGILTAEYKDHTRITSWAEAFFEIDDWIIVYLVVQFEHPNYATVTHHTYYESTKVTLANNVKIDIESNGSYNIDVDEVFSSSVNHNEVCIQTVLCKKCNEPNSTRINLKPLFFNERSLPNNEILLESYDTYNKCFTVKYNGECQRNSNFVDHLYNKKGCSHNQEQYQKLFILNRNLSGVRLIDTKEFNNRMTNALINQTNVVHKNHYFELSKLTDKPYHSQFIYFPKEPLVTTTTLHKRIFEVYTTISYIHCIPLEKAMQPLLDDTLMNIYTILNSSTKDELFLIAVESNIFKQLEKSKPHSSESFSANLSEASQNEPILPSCNSLLMDKINQIFPNMLGKSFSPHSKQGRILSRILDYLMTEDQSSHEKTFLEVMERHENSVPRRSRRSIFDTLLKDFQVFKYNHILGPENIEISSFGTQSACNLKKCDSQPTNVKSVVKAFVKTNKHIYTNKKAKADDVPVNIIKGKKSSGIKETKKKTAPSRTKKSHLGKNKRNNNIVVDGFSGVLTANQRKSNEINSLAGSPSNFSRMIAHVRASGAQFMKFRKKSGDDN